MIDVDYSEYIGMINALGKISMSMNETSNNKLEEKDKEIERLKEVEKEHQKLNGELREEIERLNNIINELEKWAEDYRFANIFKDKLQELKGSDKK